jgi:hypothetical protein
LLAEMPLSCASLAACDSATTTDRWQRVTTFGQNRFRFHPPVCILQPFAFRLLPSAFRLPRAVPLLIVSVTIKSREYELRNAWNRNALKDIEGFHFFAVNVFSRFLSLWLSSHVRA